jgi:hypothetical protein
VKKPKCEEHSEFKTARLCVGGGGTERVG